MNHKRRRPKNRRGGCLLCKPHKSNGVSRLKAARPSARRVLQEDARGRAPGGVMMTKLGK